MMISLLVIDDETIIRNGLAESIGELGLFDSILCAKNGLEALELCREHSFSAMIIDLMMPKMNGMEFLKALQDENPNGNFSQSVKIVLSGYDDFSFAQETIKYGVAEFILKPLAPAQIPEIASDLFTKASRHKKNIETISNMQRTLDLHLPDILSVFFQDVFSGRLSTQEIRTKCKELSLPFDGRIFQAAVLTISKISPTTNLSARLSREELLKHIPVQKVKDALAFLFPGQADYFAFPVQDKKMAFAFFAPGSIATELLGKLTSYCRTEHDLLLISGIGMEADCITELRTSYLEACFALRYSSFDRGSQPSMKKISDVRRYASANLNLNQIIDLHVNLKLGNKKRVHALLEEQLLAVGDDPQSCKPESLQALIMGVAFACISVFGEINVEVNNKYINDYEEMLNYDLKVTDKEECRVQIFHMIDQVLEYTKNTSSGSGKKLLEQAKKIAFAEYSDNISIAGVAERLGVSRNYLGQLFKKNEGISFSEFVNKVRVSEAQNLLKDPSLKIFEISEKVGINDPYYFSLIFKKYTGCSPSEFRKKI